MEYWVYIFHGKRKCQFLWRSRCLLTNRKGSQPYVMQFAASVVLSRCSCCSDRLACLLFIVVCCWCLCLIALPLNPGLLCGIQWAWFGAFQSTSVESWKSGYVAWMMESCCMWCCSPNSSLHGTLWWKYVCYCCMWICLLAAGLPSPLGINEWNDLHTASAAFLAISGCPTVLEWWAIAMCKRITECFSSYFVTCEM